MGGAMSQPDALLLAVLEQPGAKDIKMDIHGATFDWIATVVVQAQRQYVDIKQTLHVIDTLLAHGITFQDEDAPCQALEVVAAVFDNKRMADLLDPLLVRGAQWRGLKTDPVKHEAFFVALDNHPRVRADKLMAIAQESGVAREGGRKRVL
jgi:hypothetical protein